MKEINRRILSTFSQIRITRTLVQSTLLIINNLQHHHVMLLTLLYLHYGLKEIRKTGLAIKKQIAKFIGRKKFKLKADYPKTGPTVAIRI